ncbi:hypothetical protein ERO13_A12G137500v2 [Gossypium hirsutum]|uniref:Uncharacterized protein n=3 Tax=Gossypium TaxID=3633 RepID=A0A5J5TAB8_GOSBA|nr:hypothetical protein ES319_A12G146200v1 [Gossypium barbadense]KAG4170262.1 hypothetical protein ERO13_A12G137500v2 [Gossypium hirsutum]TYG90146.1 hypothetical protein ES288_A12G159100v1 [Gossypium darwinii]TYH96153.1 hypothetical protein ES332_A12G159300v1 [Gossypium tomentosum]
MEIRGSCTEKMALVTWRRPFGETARGSRPSGTVLAYSRSFWCSQLLSFSLGLVGPQVWAIETGSRVLMVGSDSCNWVKSRFKEFGFNLI